MRPESLMITENDVIESISDKLEEMGFNIVNKCNTSQRGIDIHAIKRDVELMIEAKGGTTSKDTRRKGKAFSTGQVKDHISVAILKAMQLKQEYPNALVGMAFPNDNKHNKVIKSISESLDRLGVYIIWSDGNETVEGLENIKF